MLGHAVSNLLLIKSFDTQPSPSEDRAQDRELAALPTRPHSNLPSPHHHPNPALGSQRDQRLRLYRLPRHEFKRHALDKRGEDELRLHHRKVVADADVRPSAKWEVGVAWDWPRIYSTPAVYQGQERGF